ncbi:N-acetyltransferase [Ruminococcaceae bacterium OttesenSCG-928-A11]|nr:N-acetyltransferase [Ruminococcaceae bacterium OttesenSCG-928-A11]
MKTIHTEAKRRFDLYGDDGIHLGEIEYMNGGNNDIYATHTEVFKGFEGKGYARTLLETLVAFAEGKGLKIVPVCPYVVAEFKKDPEKYAAVIKSKD